MPGKFVTEQLLSSERGQLKAEFAPLKLVKGLHQCKEETNGERPLL